MASLASLLVDVTELIQYCYWQSLAVSSELWYCFKHPNQDAKRAPQDNIVGLVPAASHERPRNLPPREVLPAAHRIRSVNFAVAVGVKGLRTDKRHLQIQPPESMSCPRVTNNTISDQRGRCRIGLVTKTYFEYPMQICRYPNI